MSSLPPPAPPPGSGDRPPTRFDAPAGWIDPPTAPQQTQPFGQYGQYGAGPTPQADASTKLAAGICGILLGYLGIHKFVLGYKKEGLIMLLTTVFTCGIAAIVWSVIGLIEGITYLTKSDEEFYRTYVVGHKGWF